MNGERSKKKAKGNEQIGALLLLLPFSFFLLPSPCACREKRAPRGGDSFADFGESMLLRFTAGVCIGLGGAGTPEANRVEWLLMGV
jgi:hypothetical protein